MSGERAFDDDRWPDQEGFSVCFLCGRPVDPRDPDRGSYTARADSCDPLPIHLSCADAALREPGGGDGTRIMHAFMTAINEMGKVNAKRALEAARVATSVGN
jgi:hypothetical protein